MQNKSIFTCGLRLLYLTVFLLLQHNSFPSHNDPQGLFYSTFVF